jgi:hypothetical protein
LQFPKLGEDEEQTRLHFFIRIENDHAASIMSKSGREPLKPSTRATVRDHRNAVRVRVRIRRNPQTKAPAAVSSKNFR